MDTGFLIGMAAVLTLALAAQVGITSWNIRRAGKYRWLRDTAQSREVHMAEKFKLLDKYATDISWLVDFLCDRYGGFCDIAREIDGIAENGGDAERAAKLARASKLIKAALAAHEKTKGPLKSVASFIYAITRELEECEDACKEPRMRAERCERGGGVCHCKRECEEFVGCKECDAENNAQAAL